MQRRAVRASNGRGVTNSPTCHNAARPHRIVQHHPLVPALTTNLTGFTRGRHIGSEKCAPDMSSIELVELHRVVRDCVRTCMCPLRPILYPFFDTSYPSSIFFTRTTLWINDVAPRFGHREIRALIAEDLLAFAVAQAEVGAGR